MSCFGSKADIWTRACRLVNSLLTSGLFLARNFLSHYFKCSDVVKRGSGWLRDLAGLQNAPRDGRGLAARDVDMRVENVVSLFMELFEFANNTIQPPDSDLSCHELSP